MIPEAHGSGHVQFVEVPQGDAIPKIEATAA